MASQAHMAFLKNREEIEQLHEIHKAIEGDHAGRRAVNKSAFVLLTAFWEAFCEDLAAEALHHLVTQAPDADALPVELRRRIAKSLTDSKHELAAWTLAGDGWRRVLSDRLGRLQEQRNRQLNAPGTRQIDELFRDVLGIEKISATWHWRNMAAERATEKLDEFIVLRHEIAHRGRPDGTIHKYDVNEYDNHIVGLVGRTDEAVGLRVAEVTGTHPWHATNAP